MTNRTFEAPIERTGAVLTTDAIYSFADEFSSLLRNAHENNMSAEGRRKLDALLSTFDDLVKEMRAASADITRLISN
jgi:hypothetical protein